MTAHNLMSSSLPDSSTTAYQTGLITRFILSHVHPRSPGSRPLFISIQGPQGAGKSTLARSVQSELTCRHGYSVAVISLDGKSICGHLNPTNKKSHPIRLTHASRGRPPPHTQTFTSLIQTWLNWNVRIPAISSYMVVVSRAPTIFPSSSRR